MLETPNPPSLRVMSNKLYRLAKGLEHLDTLPENSRETLEANRAIGDEVTAALKLVMSDQWRTFGLLDDAELAGRAVLADALQGIATALTASGANSWGGKGPTVGATMSDNRPTPQLIVDEWAQRRVILLRWAQLAELWYNKRQGPNANWAVRGTKSESNQIPVAGKGAGTLSGKASDPTHFRLARRGSSWRVKSRRKGISHEPAIFPVFII